MAKERYITKTIQATVVKVKDGKEEKEISYPNMSMETVKAVYAASGIIYEEISEKEIRYGIKETDFIKYGKELKPLKKNSSENE